ncbi:MAG: hypothetical protein BroJett029_15670 [Alphaproteobacteria bacterium]|nr:MAG: hypothetical protein BroJett029_15670 [Alphaproteobacteria bacterium]
MSIAEAAAAPRPKYAPWLTLLQDDPGHLRNSPAPSYWALSAFHIGQFTESCCSLATAVMLVNAARGSRHLAVGEKLVTQRDLLAAVNDPNWTFHCTDAQGNGASLREMAPIMERAYALYGVAGATVEMVQVTDAVAAADRFRQALAAMERAPTTQIALNFDGASVYGPVDYGHFSPAAAYDAGRDRVLVLDVDRDWHEPYWVPVEIMLKAMATASRKDGTPRGYLRVTLAG